MWKSWKPIPTFGYQLFMKKAAPTWTVNLPTKKKLLNVKRKTKSLIILNTNNPKQLSVQKPFPKKPWKTIPFPLLHQLALGLGGTNQLASFPSSPIVTPQNGTNKFVSNPNQGGFQRLKFAFGLETSVVWVGSEVSLFFGLILFKKLCGSTFQTKKTFWAMVYDDILQEMKGNLPVLHGS